MIPLMFSVPIRPTCMAASISWRHRMGGIWVGGRVDHRIWSH